MVNLNAGAVALITGIKKSIVCEDVMEKSEHVFSAAKGISLQKI
jgi:isoaspartyl peptidase/L-asparaginase-like protein (Ntn-hydrolase superfamily)